MRAQVWNHTFYFESFSNDGQKNTSGDLAEAINKSFGSFDAFKEQFNKAAATLFGSGWAWLVKNDDGTLADCAGIKCRKSIAQGS